MPRLLDLFCGRWGWSRAFAARGWECVGVDWAGKWADCPERCELIRTDVLEITPGFVLAGKFDFICASSPCEEFSKFGMRCFFPNPEYPDYGINLFNHTRWLCWTSGLPWVMENVRAAQDFVGKSRHHCGPFHLWGTGVPELMPQGIIKCMTRKALGHYDYEGEPGWNTKNEKAERRQNGANAAGLAATIPPELANCVADHAERLLEQRVKV